MTKGSGGGKGGSHGGKGGGSGKSSSRSMSKADASRIQSASDRHPESASAKSGFDERAQSAADRGANE
jgi:hypothetical protein